MVPEEAERLVKKIFAACDTNADGYLDKAEQTNMIKTYIKNMRTESEDTTNWSKEEEKMLATYF